VEALGLTPEQRARYRLVDYLHEIDRDYAAADLVICRAGAGTLYEICRCGLPALVIPKAGLPGDHQSINARALERAGAAEVLYESPLENPPLDAGVLAARVRELLADPERRRALAAAARGFVAFSASERIRTALGALLDGDAAGAVARIAAEDAAGGKAEQWRDRFAVSRPEALIRRLEKMEAPRGLAGISAADRRFLHYRTDCCLASTDWLVCNAGVKLVGLTGHRARLPVLRGLLEHPRGFVRRNIFQALWRLEVTEDPVPEMLLRGLEDPYFEVRSWAARAIRRLAPGLAGRERYSPLLRRMGAERNFEVRREALKTIGRLCATVEEALPLLRENYYHPNCHVREAVIAALRTLVERGLLEAAAARRELADVLVTSNDFRPRFQLKEEIRKLQRLLQERGA